MVELAHGVEQVGDQPRTGGEGLAFLPVGRIGVADGADQAREIRAEGYRAVAGIRAGPKSLSHR